MKYKVLKGTKLFDDLVSVKNKINKVNKASFDLAKSLGFDKIAKKSFVLAGGIAAFGAKNKPEGYGYAYGSRNTEAFYPKKIKANKEILAKIEALPVVEYEEVNNLLNYDERKLAVTSHRNDGSQRIIFTPGLYYEKDYILIDLDEEQTAYKPVKGMVEILPSEFYKLTKIK